MLLRIDPKVRMWTDSSTELVLPYCSKWQKNETIFRQDLHGPTTDVRFQLRSRYGAPKSVTEHDTFDSGPGAAHFWWMVVNVFRESSPKKLLQLNHDLDLC